MKLSGSAAMGVFFAGVAGAVVVTAAEWPFKTALFPLAIGIPVFLMALAEAYLSFSGQSSEEAGGYDFKLSAGGYDQLRRTIRIFAWILGFFFLILLIGFPIAIPIFFIAFYRLYGKEGWKLSIGLSAAAWVSFYGLFVWLLNVPFREGWLFRLF